MNYKLYDKTEQNENVTKIKNFSNKLQKNSKKLFSMFDKDSAARKMISGSSSSKKTDFKEITDLIQKPEVIDASNDPTELPEKSHLSFKIKRRQALDTAEMERIYESKNYKYVSMNEVRPADELERLHKNSEREKNDPTLKSGKPE